MPKRFYSIVKGIVFSCLIFATLPPRPASAFIFTGGSTEWTQLLNNAELIHLSGQSADQIQNQVVQIGQMAEQIQNQMRIYENMLQNTLQLPDHVWGEVEADLLRLKQLVSQGEGIAFSMANLDDVLKQRFASFAAFEAGLPDGNTFSDSYQSWSDTNRETIAATLRAAGLTSEQLSSEELTMAQIRTLSERAEGQMQALQVGHDLAAQQVGQAQKLRGLVSQQVTMMASWHQSEQAARDLAQARRAAFFNATTPPISGGQEMEPRW